MLVTFNMGSASLSDVDFAFDHWRSQCKDNNNSSKKHMLNLVINQTKQASASEDDYLTLEFRHNAYDDEPRTLGWGVVSFRLKEIANQLAGKKGLKIIVNTIYDGKQTYTVDLKK